MFGTGYAVWATTLSTVSMITNSDMAIVLLLQTVGLLNYYPLLSSVTFRK